MYTTEQIETVIKYNQIREVFRITERRRVVWNMLYGNVSDLDAFGIKIVTAEDFSQLKKQVRAELMSRNLI
jgi:hypothetical protein